MNIVNRMNITFSGIASNESFARVVISAFAVQANPTMDELQDIKMAISEAVTNAIVHGYDGDGEGLVTMSAELSDDGEISITVSDDGVGIADLEQAREPFFTTKPELERSGMGFTVMESFMDSVAVESESGRGTKVIMRKQFLAAAKADLSCESGNSDNTV